MANIVRKTLDRSKPNVMFEVWNGTIQDSSSTQCSTGALSNYDTMTWSKFSHSEHWAIPLCFWWNQIMQDLVEMTLSLMISSYVLVSLFIVVSVIQVSSSASRFWMSLPILLTLKNPIKCWNKTLIKDNNLIVHR